MNRLLEPVFLFLTCRVAPVSGLRKVWRGKIPQRSEDDFSPANPFRGLTLLNPKAEGYICCKKEKCRMDFINKKKNGRIFYFMILK